jgi:hypothetical protein
MKKRALKKAFPLLKLLNELPSAGRDALLPHLDTNACDAIYLCIYNGLYNSGISPQQRASLLKALSSKKRALRALARSVTDRKVSDALRKKRLIQSGGSLGMILGVALPLLANFLFNK